MDDAHERHRTVQPTPTEAAASIPAEPAAADSQPVSVRRRRGAARQAAAPRRARALRRRTGDAAAAQARARGDGRGPARPGATTTCPPPKPGRAEERGMSAERRCPDRSSARCRDSRRARVFVLALFIGFCVIFGFTKTEADRRRRRMVVKSLDERSATSRCSTCADASARTGRSAQAPELLEAAARKS